MPRPSPFERARLYAARMPAAVSGSGGHRSTFAVAMVLLQGFDLPRHEARAILDEYNQRCDPPWNDRELEHKLNQADKQNGFTTAEGLQPRGCLRDDAGDERHDSAPSESRPAPPPPPKLEFDREKLERAAGHFAQTVDLVWLANRSALDPALVRPGKFLSSLYRPGERVLVFTNDKTQGEAVWPGDELPSSGPRGVWFLCQPVDGAEHPNPRTQKVSRRSEESVTDWRFLVLESDEAPLRPWLGALAQLPLRIAAIYTSGSRSVHALVRVDAATKAQWDERKHAMKTGLVILGADPGAMSAVRLTRLPGCYREGKDAPTPDGRRAYQRFARPALQKLLYLNPEAPLRPLVDTLARRDTEADWLRLAAAGVSDADETGGGWLKRGLEFYATVSPRIKAALAALEEVPA